LNRGEALFDDDSCPHEHQMREERLGPDAHLGGERFLSSPEQKNSSETTEHLEPDAQPVASL